VQGLAWNTLEAELPRFLPSVERLCYEGFFFLSLFFFIFLFFGLILPPNMQIFSIAFFVFPYFYYQIFITFRASTKQ